MSIYAPPARAFVGGGLGSPRARRARRRPLFCVTGGGAAPGLCPRRAGRARAAGPHLPDTPCEPPCSARGAAALGGGGAVAGPTLLSVDHSPRGCAHHTVDRTATKPCTYLARARAPRARELARTDSHARRGCRARRPRAARAGARGRAPRAAGGRGAADCGAGAAAGARFVCTAYGRREAPTRPGTAAFGRTNNARRPLCANPPGLAPPAA